MTNGLHPLYTATKEVFGFLLPSFSIQHLAYRQEPNAYPSLGYYVANTSQSAYDKPQSLIRETRTLVLSVEVKESAWRDVEEIKHIEDTMRVQEHFADTFNAYVAILCNPKGVKGGHLDKRGYKYKHLNFRYEGANTTIPLYEHGDHRTVGIMRELRISYDVRPDLCCSSPESLHQWRAWQALAEQGSAAYDFIQQEIDAL